MAGDGARHVLGLLDGGAARLRPGAALVGGVGVQPGRSVDARARQLRRLGLGPTPYRARATGHITLVIDTVIKNSTVPFAFFTLCTLD